MKILLFLQLIHDLPQLPIFQQNKNNFFSNFPRKFPTLVLRREHTHDLCKLDLLKIRSWKRKLGQKNLGRKLMNNVSQKNHAKKPLAFSAYFFSFNNSATLSYLCPTPLKLCLVCVTFSVFPE